MSTRFWWFGFCLISILTVHSKAFASTGETYGYGSRASALGNTMLGGIQDGYSTFYNPAANSANSGLRLSLGVAYAKPSFLEIKDIVVGNTAVAAETGDVLGSVKNDDYLDHLGQTVGASLNFGEKWKLLTVGLTGSLPITRLAYLDTGEAFRPEYFGYRSRTQRPQVYASMSVSPFQNFYMGTGIAISTNLAANTTLYATTNPGSVSYQRFSSTIKPGAAPYFSLYGTPSKLIWGVTARLPNRYTLSIDTNASARVFGTQICMPLVTNSASTLYYDPLEVDLGMGLHITPQTFATLEVDWFQYKKYESPTVKVVDKGSGAALLTSISNVPTMRDIFVPKLGLEHRFEKFKARFGYAFRKSPVENNNGPGNLIDPDKHLFSLGAGIDLKEAGMVAQNLILDLHAQYHWLVRKRVTKALGNEVGTLSQSKVGAPGYDIGGKIYSAGLSFSMAF